MSLTREQRAAYGLDWPAVSRLVRDRSGGRCECEGECEWERHKMHNRAERFEETPDLRCPARNGERSPLTGSLVVLTAAHLDRNGHKGSHDEGRIKAMCQGCHLSYDRLAR